MLSPAPSLAPPHPLATPFIAVSSDPCFGRFTCDALSPCQTPSHKGEGAARTTGRGTLPERTSHTAVAADVL
jgi:hypothetical protein